MTENRVNHLLDFRESGEIGSMKIITLNFAVENGEDLKQTMEWLTKKLFDNKRRFTFGDYAPPSTDTEIPGRSEKVTAWTERVVVQQ